MGGRAGGGGEDRGAAALRRAPKPARMSTGSIRTSVLCIALAESFHELCTDLLVAHAARSAVRLREAATGCTLNEALLQRNAPFRVTRSPRPNKLKAPLAPPRRGLTCSGSHLSPGATLPRRSSGTTPGASAGHRLRKAYRTPEGDGGADAQPVPSVGRGHRDKLPLV